MDLKLPVLILCLIVLASARGETMEKIKLFDAALNKVVIVEKIEKNAAAWRKLLTPEQYEVTTNQGTEKPFT